MSAQEWMQNKNRLQQILDVASNLIDDESALSEQEIDRNFIFGFEYGWQLRVIKIRTWLNQLARIGESHKLLPSDISPKMWAYLEVTKNLMDFPENITLDESFVLDDSFRPFDEELSKKYNKSISAAIGGSRTQLEYIWPLIEREKEFVGALQNSILLVAQQYQIVPLGFDLWNRFPFKNIELALVNLRNYFLFDHPLPKFIWPDIAYIESKVDKGVLRWLRPDPVAPRSAESFQQTRVRPITRIRTWAVYFQSKRGGGLSSEREAVNLWNEHFNDNLSPRNFRSERSTLLQGVSKTSKSG